MKALVIGSALLLLVACSERKRVSGGGVVILPDAAAQKDGSTGADANGLDAAADGGVEMDAGGAVDTGFEMDSGGPVDTGVPTDTGVPADAGGPADTGVPPDAGSPDTGAGDSGTGGACNNPADLAILQMIDAQTQATTCGLSCIQDPNLVMCSTTCVENATGLSNACSMCFAQTIECTIMNCLTSCIDPSSPACDQCQINAGCRAALLACAGV